jgi:hypothetical protein
MKVIYEGNFLNNQREGFGTQIWYRKKDNGKFVE